MKNNNLFWYTTIFILIVYYVSTLTIGINFMFGVGVAMIVIWLIYIRDNQTNSDKIVLQEKKISLIKPRPKTSKDEIVNFLFSIQDFYEYNPMAYENMVENIDQFFDRYNEILRDKSLAGINYELMTELKRNILNSLHSIIYKLTPNNDYDNKLTRAIKAINNILQKYLDDVEHINNEFIYDNGIKHTSKFIKKTSVKPINVYDEDMSTYEIF